MIQNAKTVSSCRWFSAKLVDWATLLVVVPKSEAASLLTPPTKAPFYVLYIHEMSRFRDGYCLRTYFVCNGAVEFSICPSYVLRHLDHIAKGYWLPHYHTDLDTESINTPVLV